MKNFNLTLLIFSCFLILGSNVLAYLNIEEDTFQVILISISLIQSITLYKSIKEYNQLLFLISFVCIFSIYKIFTDTGEGTRYLLLTIIGAPIIISTFPINNSYISKHTISFWRKIFKIFIYLYIVEIIIVLYERANGHMVFGWASLTNESIESMGVTNFRSTGLYGHPLYNALMVSIAMAFILISPLHSTKKYFLWGCGYLAIMCFNTRSGIVINAMFFLLYILNNLISNNDKYGSKFKNVFIALLVGFSSFFILSTGQIGGRLSEMGLIDDNSSQVRIESLQFIYSADIKEFATGMTYDDYNNLLTANQLRATENYWIDYLLRFGLIFIVPYIFFYYKYLKREFSEYSLFDKLFIVSVFLSTSSINNSLSSSFIALLYFLILIRLFSPNNIHLIIK